MSRHSLIILATAALLVTRGAAQAPAAPPAEVLQIPEPGRFKGLFVPFRTDNAAISPDGKYLAYSIREEDKLFVVVVEADQPGNVTARVQVVSDEAATPMLDMTQIAKTPGRINWLGWTTANRVLVETNRVVPLAGTGDRWLNWRGTVLGFDADGGNAKVLLNPTDVDEFDNDGGAGQISRAMRMDQNPAQTGRPGDQRTGRVGDSTMPAAASASVTAPMENGDAPVPTVPRPDERLVPPVLNGAPQLRTVHILDFDHERPGSVLVVAAGQAPNGMLTLALYSLNGQTGKLKALSDEPVTQRQDTLLDRQGRIRISVANSLRLPFPHRYEYLGPKGTSLAKPLEDVTGIAGFSVSPDNYFGERAVPLGFDYDPAILYYAANTGRDTYGVYSVNLSTRQPGHVRMENPVYDLFTPGDAGFPDRNQLVFDRFSRQLAGIRYEGPLGTTVWTRPEWQDMQAGFEKAFPGVSVKITDWDQAGKRFVISTEGPANPGAFAVFDSNTRKLTEIVRRAPWIDATKAHPTRPFSYPTKDGAHLSGLITAPRQPRLKPIPVVVVCPDLPWQRVHGEFQAEVQALAEMGFVVVQLNGRGAWGQGLKQRQSVTTGYDTVQAADIAAAVTHLGTVFQINAQRIALVGRGHGGFIALRALQAYPDMFRCAIALDAPVNLGDWLSEQRWTGGAAQAQLTRAWFGDAARLQASPLADHPEGITKPVLMLNYPGPRVGESRMTYGAARQFAERVAGHGTSAEFGRLTTDYMNGLPQARAAVFDQIEEFLNLHIYDFKVKVHETQVIK